VSKATGLSIQLDVYTHTQLSGVIALTMCYCNSGVPHITPSMVAVVDDLSSAADLV